MLKAAIVSALLVGAAPTITTAGPVADAAARAEALQAEGKTLEALDALDEGIETLWAATPLLFRKVTLIGATDGNGPAEPPDRTYRPDERLVVTVAPVGYSYRTAETGFTVDLVGDLAIANATGQVFAEQTDIFSLTADSAAKDRHLSMDLSFGVPYLRPGDYVARFTLRDKNSGKSGSFEVPFAIAAPGTAN